MPIKFRLDLKLNLKKPLEELPQANPFLRKWTIYPDQVHGFFLNLFPPKERELLHSPSPVKPFALWCKEIFINSEHPLTELWLYVSFLKDELFSSFLYHFLNLEQLPPLGVYEVRVNFPEKGIVKKDEYFQLMLPEITSEQKYLRFDFLTPVSFRVGNFDYPLPEPRLIFKSLHKKWNFFIPQKFSWEEVSKAVSQCYIAYHSVFAQKVYLSMGGGVIGFRGRLLLGRGKATDREWNLLLNLAKFGEFAGVGRKTTMGFGQIKVTFLRGIDQHE